MSFRQEALFPPTNEHLEVLNKAVEIAAKHPDAKGFLIMDVDGVRDDSLSRLIELLYERFGITDPHPDTEQLKKELGYQVGKLFEMMYGIPKQEVKKAQKELEKSGIIYQKVDLVDPDLPLALTRLQESEVVPILWLTARHREHMELSRREALRHNLPDIPVYAESPEDKDYAEMKWQVLLKLASAIPGKPLYMVDDNKKLIDKIEASDYERLNGIYFDTSDTFENMIRRKAGLPTANKTPRRNISA